MCLALRSHQIDRLVKWITVGRQVGDVVGLEDGWMIDIGSVDGSAVGVQVGDGVGDQWLHRRARRRHRGGVRAWVRRQLSSWQRGGQL